MAFRINKGIFQAWDGKGYVNRFKIDETDGELKEVDDTGAALAPYMKIGDKATDSDKLDGLDSGAFLRSNASDDMYGTLTVHSGGANSYGRIRGYGNDNHFIVMRGIVSTNTSTLTITGGHRTTFVEHAESNDNTGWYFVSKQTGKYQEVARITRSGITAPNYNDSNWNTAYNWGNHASAGYLKTSVLSEAQAGLLKTSLGVSGLPYTCDIVLNGDPNLFYPVHFFGGDQNIWRRIIISRNYSWQAPPDWYTSTHKGGLLLDWEGNFGGWGGATYSDRLRVFNQQYSNMVADMYRYTHSMGYVFFLRGGGDTGALYRIFSDQPINGRHQSGTPDIGYDPSFVFYPNNNASYVVTAPEPLTLEQINSRRIDDLRTLKRSEMDSRYQPVGSYLTTSGKAADSEKVDGINGASLLRSDANDTFTGTLTMGKQHALVANNYGRGVYGVYSSTRYQHVWSMGTAYNLADNGTGTGNLYGISWTHSNVGGESISGLGHQMLIMSNGDTRSAIGDGIWTKYNVYASGGNSTEWNAAYDWGNHGSAGYALANTLGSLALEDSVTIAEVDGLQTALNGKLSTTGKAADSNLLDGVDSSRFIYGGNSTRTTNISNFSTALNSGFYDGYNATGNPTSSWYTLINMRHNNTSNNYGSQIAVSFYSNADMYVRTISNGTYQGWSKIWNSANFDPASKLGATAKAADSDKLDGYDWMQSGKAVRGSEIYSDGWLRNYNTKKGLYNHATGQHFYSDDDDYWNIAGGTAANGLRFRDEHDGTVRGYVYANNSNQVGFLDAGGTWAIKHVNDSHTEFQDAGEKVFSVGQGGHGSNYGTVCTHGGGRGGWEGYSINGRFVWMSADSSSSGIYNDTDNEWMTRWHRNGATELYHNGSRKFLTNGSGVTTEGNMTVSGSVTASSFSGNGSGLTGVSAPIPFTTVTGEATACVSMNFDGRAMVFTMADGTSYSIDGARPNQ